MKDKQMKLRNERNIAIAEFLNTYIANSDPRYAVLITGKWGSGKSHFVDKWLENINLFDKDEKENDIFLKPIKISLYGKTEISQITEDIDQLLNPFIYSKLYKFGMNVFKLLGRFALKTDLDINGDGTKDATITGSIDSLSIFQSDDKNIKGVKFLIFDDLERCQIEMKRLLGYINYFVEKCNCHVLIMGDETHATEENKVQLTEFKEKTVGRQFEIVPEIENALDEFLTQDLPVVDWLTDKRDLLVKAFDASGTSNLRILRQAVYDFKMILQTLDKGLVKTDKAFLRGFVVTYFATCYGLKSDYNSALINLAKNKLTQEDRNKLSEFNNKYKYRFEQDNINILNSDHVSKIVESITKGTSLKPYIEKLLMLNQTPPTAIERLSSFMNMEKSEFKQTCKDLEQILASGHLDNVYMIGRGLAFLGFFDMKKMYLLTMKTQNCVSKTIKRKLDEAKNQEEIFEIRMSFIRGLNSFNSDVDMPKIKTIVSNIDAVFEDKKTNLPNTMKVFLQNLSDNNIEQLYCLDHETMPGHGKSYYLSSIFKDVNGKQIHKKVAALSNKGKNYFRMFLESHYNLSSNISFAHYYKDDEQTLVDLKKYFDADYTKAASIDKYTIEKLISTIERCIKRCSGQNDAVC